MPPRYPLRPVADRLLPRRRGAHGAVQLGAGHASTAARSCCASRTPTRPATGRSGRRASSTRWPGSASRADDPTFEGPYFQSAYAAAHVAAAERLFERGPRLLLRLTPRADPGARQGARASPATTATPATAASSPGPGRVLRFRVPDGDDGRRRPRSAARSTFDNDTIEDFVLLRGNGTPMFLLANVVDDIEMGITHVVRGEEHLPNTPKQQLLWEALGHAPPVWAHVPVLVNEQRKKLSKRRDKVALEQYRDEGYLADGDGQLPDDARLGAAGRQRDRAVGGDRGTSSGSRTSPTRRRSSTSRSSPRSTASTSGRCRVDEFVAACEPWLPGRLRPRRVRRRSPRSCRPGS